MNMLAWEVRLEELVDDAFSSGFERGDIIAALELRLMALKEEEDDE